eukprot:GILI01005165.1.p1 GENE.GILI01005165.1~~GILI01005165.1.p1  ORF type:complete len:313 (+),score=40.64 GILI01005165.1:146-1084(+)
MLIMSIPDTASPFFCGGRLDGARVFTPHLVPPPSVFAESDSGDVDQFLSVIPPPPLPLVSKHDRSLSCPNIFAPSETAGVVINNLDDSFSLSLPSSPCIPNDDVEIPEPIAFGFSHDPLFGIGGLLLKDKSPSNSKPPVAPCFVDKRHSFASDSAPCLLAQHLFEILQDFYADVSLNVKKWKVNALLKHKSHAIKLQIRFFTSPSASSSPAVLSSGSRTPSACPISSSVSSSPDSSFVLSEEAVGADMPAAASIGLTLAGDQPLQVEGSDNQPPDIFLVEFSRRQGNCVVFEAFYKKLMQEVQKRGLVFSTV